MEPFPGAGDTAGLPGPSRRGLGRGSSEATPSCQEKEEGEGCSHMEMEVTELSAVGGDGEEGRAESVFRERSWEFRGSRGERVTARKEPVPSVGAERRGKDTWGIWCRAVSCVLAGEDFKAVRFSGGNG